ncbi:SUMO ligase [Aphelenchoides avenae]|nr:SUMO ligase [Aphelenchus avenae]
MRHVCLRNVYTATIRQFHDHGNDRCPMLRRTNPASTCRCTPVFVRVIAWNSTQRSKTIDSITKGLKCMTTLLTSSYVANLIVDRLSLSTETVAEINKFRETVTDSVFNDVKFSCCVARTLNNETFEGIVSGFSGMSTLKLAHCTLNLSQISDTFLDRALARGITQLQVLNEPSDNFKYAVTIGGVVNFSSAHPELGRYRWLHLPFNDFCLGGYNRIVERFEENAMEHVMVTIGTTRYSAVPNDSRKRGTPVEDWKEAFDAIVRTKALRIPAVVTRLRLRQQIRNADSEVHELEAVSFVCPVSQKRIDVAARGGNCTHLQCFDLASYLQAHGCLGQRQCPICSSDMNLEDLRIDELFNSILRSTLSSANVEKVEIRSNGTYRTCFPEDTRPQTILGNRSPSMQAVKEEVPVSDSSIQEATASSLVSIRPDATIPPGAIPSNDNAATGVATATAAEAASRPCFSFKSSPTSAPSTSQSSARTTNAGAPFKFSFKTLASCTANSTPLTTIKSEPGPVKTDRQCPKEATLEGSMAVIAPLTTNDTMVAGQGLPEATNATHSASAPLPGSCDKEVQTSPKANDDSEPCSSLAIFVSRKLKETNAELQRVSRELEAEKAARQSLEQQMLVQRFHATTSEKKLLDAKVEKLNAEKVDLNKKYWTQKNSNDSIVAELDTARKRLRTKRSAAPPTPAVASTDASSTMAIHVTTPRLVQSTSTDAEATGNKATTDLSQPKPPGEATARSMTAMTTTTKSLTTTTPLFGSTFTNAEAPSLASYTARGSTRLRLRWSLLDAFPQATPEARTLTTTITAVPAPLFSVATVSADSPGTQEPAFHSSIQAATASSLASIRANATFPLSVTSSDDNVATGVAAAIAAETASRPSFSFKTTNASGAASMTLNSALTTDAGAPSKVSLKTLASRNPGDNTRTGAIIGRVSSSAAQHQSTGYAAVKGAATDTDWTIFGTASNLCSSVEPVSKKQRLLGGFRRVDYPTYTSSSRLQQSHKMSAAASSSKSAVERALDFGDRRAFGSAATFGGFAKFGWQSAFGGGLSNATALSAVASSDTSDAGVGFPVAKGASIRAQFRILRPEVLMLLRHLRKIRRQRVPSRRILRAPRALPGAGTGSDRNAPTTEGARSVRSRHDGARDHVPKWKLTATRELAAQRCRRTFSSGDARTALHRDPALASSSVPKKPDTVEIHRLTRSATLRRSQRLRLKARPRTPYSPAQPRRQPRPGSAPSPTHRRSSSAVRNRRKPTQHAPV